MATIGIMSYGIPSDLKLKNTFNKITITTNGVSNSNIGVLSDSSGSKLGINSNTIVKKIKDFGMIGSVCNSGTIIMRRKQKLVPLSESNTDNISQRITSEDHSNPPPAKKFKTGIKTGESKASNLPRIINDSTPSHGRKGLPAPQAVARRNARERNRVKQVNNGFAALRQHIPEEIAKAFETASSSNRGGSAKKLSKVETLRMAVEYIRGLEKLLGYDIPPVSPTSTDDGCVTVIKNEFTSISPLPDHLEGYDDNLGDDLSERDFTSITDGLPTITTLNGLQYIRIPGTNTYQLLTADLFGNEENFSPLIDNNCYTNNDDLVEEEIPVEMLATSIAPASPVPELKRTPTNTASCITSSLSPTLSSSVLSPAPAGILLPSTVPGSRATNEHFMIPSQQFTIHEVPHLHDNNPLPHIKVETPDIVYHIQDQQQLLDHQATHLDGTEQGYYLSTSSAEKCNEEEINFEDVVCLKKELKNVILDNSTAGLSDESMMDAIDWWETNTPKSEGHNII